MSTPAGANITERAVLDVLRGIKDPDLGKDIVTLGMVQDLHIHEANVTFTLAFTGQPPASKVALHSGASKAVSQIPGVSRVQVKMGSAATAARPSAPPEPAAADFIPEVKHTVAVSSGKGGVGKSTIAVNLALALKQMGA
jgi:ATP-binding protein involved in chromosome partitioning